jgi:hypothetical protein
MTWCFFFFFFASEQRCSFLQPGGRIWGSGTLQASESSTVADWRRKLAVEFLSGERSCDWRALAISGGAGSDFAASRSDRIWRSLVESIFVTHATVSQSESHCDWRSVSLSVLVPSLVWGSWPDIRYCLTVIVLSLGGRPLVREGGLSESVSCIRSIVSMSNCLHFTWY